jgi:hypothetical protein
MAEPAKKGKSRDEINALKRKIIFVPCMSKEALHKWIRLFLGFDVPDCIVDPDSTSTPMDMIWECYSKAYQNNDKSFARVMYYAARDSFKTLCVAMLEVLAVLHLKRNVAHMAAVEGQSEKCQEYVKTFMSQPVIRDYISGDNLRRVEVSRYLNTDTGECIPEARWKALSPELRDGPWDEIRNYIKIVICTPQGANSEHVPFFVVDEVDVVMNERAYGEAKSIPAPLNGMMPLTVFISTRKTSTGLVQREIDDAIDMDTGVTKLHVRHWNLIDVTEACPPERHLPEEPKIPIYVREDQLRAIDESRFKGLSEPEQQRYVKEEGYVGCLKNCRLFASCHGYLATNQKSKSELLKPIEHTINQISGGTVDYALAQYLCKKPSAAGLIYPNFNRDEHVITASQMAEMIQGFPGDPRLDKKGLIEMMRQRDMLCYAGMDFGYAHNFAVVTFFCDGYRAFVVDVIAEPELLPDQMVKICTERLKDWNPVIFPDMENKQMIAVLRRAGFRMREWQKVAGTVVGGINVVHLKLRPPMSEPLLYFLAGDPGVELLVKRIQKYHWVTDAADRVTDRPTEREDDECDALRYGIMNVFSAEKGRPAVAQDGPAPPPTHPAHVYPIENWMSKVIEERGGYSEGSVGSSGRRGRFGWVI